MTKKCKWCGCGFEEPNSFVVGATLGIFGHESYCSNACKHAAKEAKGTKSSGGFLGGSIMPQGRNMGSRETINIGENPLTAFFNSTAGTIMQRQADYHEKEMAQKEMAREDKANLEQQIASIATMVIGGSTDEISNQLNQLVSLGSANPDKKLKSAIVEKLEFGILKLRSAGANTEASYFEGKLEPLKKKSWF